MVEVALLVALSAARAADLPPGAVLRLGDARWRNGGLVTELALSPDGKQSVTVRSTGLGVGALTVWDVDTGRPVRSAGVNPELLQGFAWGPGGGVAVVRRAEPPAKKDAPGTLDPADFRVWAFTDPAATPPPVLPGSADPFATGTSVRAVRPKGGPEYTSFAVAGDARRIAALHRAADGAHRIDVFEAKPAASARQLVRVRSVPVDDPRGVVLSRDGRTVVAGVSMGEPGSPRSRVQVRAWDVATGKAGEAFDHPGRLVDDGLSPDGRLLAVLTPGGALQLLDLTTGKPAGAEVPLPAAPPGGRLSPFHPAVAFWPDGRRLVATTGRGAVVVDVPGRKVLARLEGHADEGSAVAVSADGARVAVGDAAGLVRVWDAATYRPLTDPTGHRANVEYAELSPDGRRLLTSADDETVRVWDLVTGREMRAFAGAAGVPDDQGYRPRPTFTPDGLAVLFSTADRRVRRDVTTGLEVPLPGGLAKLGPGFAVFAPDGTAVLRWGADRRPLTVWEWPAGKERVTVEAEVPAGWDAAGFSPDGAAVFAHPQDPERWDARTGKTLPPAWAAAAGESAFAFPTLALRPNPRVVTLYPAAVKDPDVKVVVGAGSGRPVAGFSAPGDSAEAVPIFSRPLALCRGGRQFVPGPQLGALVPSEEVWVCEVATGAARRKLPEEGRVLGFTPDGTKLLTAGADHTVLVWDVRPQALPLPDAVKREASAAKLWATMCVGKAEASYAAMARLAAEPDAAVKTARLRLKPASAPDAATLSRLLRQLGDPDFRTREAAEAALDGYGEPAAELVKGRLAKLESAEARRRAEGFVGRWVGGGRDAVRLADTRAVELLEALGTPAAKEFLKELAGGDAAAFRTQEAKRAVERFR